MNKAFTYSATSRSFSTLSSKNFTKSSSFALSNSLTTSLLDGAWDKWEETCVYLCAALIISSSMTLFVINNRVILQAACIFFSLAAFSNVACALVRRVFSEKACAERRTRKPCVNTNQFGVH